MSKACKWCGSTEHTQFYCYKKPRTWIIKSGKPLRNGKVWARWSECKKDWYEKFGTDHPCHYCGLLLAKETITLDHKVSRSRAPELRYDFANLVPCCWQCNGLKGSLDHDEFDHVCRD